MYRPEVSREIELKYVCVYVHMKREREREGTLFERIGLQDCGVWKVQSARHASRLETHARVHVATSAGKALWRQYSSSRDFSLFSEAFNQVDEA